MTIGLGTRKLTDSKCYDTVRIALDIGYRHIDTASVYANETQIGQARRDSEISREDLHLTSKIFVYDYLTVDTIKHSIEQSLQDLQTDYLDLIYLHRPTNSEDHLRVIDTLLPYYHNGKIRHIGISNFTSTQIDDIAQYYPGLISHYQGEYHVCLNQSIILSTCDKYNMHFEAYSPLGHGKIRSHNQTMETLTLIAEKHHVSVTQIMLARLLDQHITVLPKSSQRIHLIENQMSKHVILDEEDRLMIAGLPKTFRYCNPSQIAPVRDL